VPGSGPRGSRSREQRRALKHARAPSRPGNNGGALAGSSGPASSTVALGPSQTGRHLVFTVSPCFQAPRTSSDSPGFKPHGPIDLRFPHGPIPADLHVSPHGRILPPRGIRWDQLNMTVSSWSNTALDHFSTKSSAHQGIVRQGASPAREIGSQLRRNFNPLTSARFRYLHPYAAQRKRLSSLIARRSTSLRG
jgi:hypothetical protein